MKAIKYIEIILGVLSDLTFNRKETKDFLADLAEKAICSRVRDRDQSDARVQLYTILGGGYDEYDYLIAVANLLLSTQSRAMHFSGGRAKSFHDMDIKGAGLRRHLSLESASRVIIGHSLDLLAEEREFKYRKGNMPSGKTDLAAMQNLLHHSALARLEYQNRAYHRMIELNESYRIAWLSPGLIVEQRLGSALTAPDLYVKGPNFKPVPIYPEYADSVQKCNVSYSAKFLEAYPMPWLPRACSQKKPGRPKKGVLFETTHVFEFLGAGIVAQRIGIESWRGVEELGSAAIALVESGAYICRPKPTTSAGDHLKAFLALFDALNPSPPNQVIIKPWFAHGALKRSRRDAWGKPEAPSNDDLWNFKLAYNEAVARSSMEGQGFIEMLRSDGIPEWFLKDLQLYGLAIGN